MERLFQVREVDDGWIVYPFTNPPTGDSFEDVHTSRRDADDLAGQLNLSVDRYTDRLKRLLAYYEELEFVYRDLADVRERQVAAVLGMTVEQWRQECEERLAGTEV